MQKLYFSRCFWYAMLFENVLSKKELPQMDEQKEKETVAVA